MGAPTVVHPTALVARSALLGQGVRIGPFCVVENGARIGDGSILEGYVRIKGSVMLGRNCRVFENCVLGGDPQDHDFGNEPSFVRIGDDVILRENVTIHRATGENRETIVESGTMLMEGCHVAHNVRIGRRCTITNKVGFSGHVEVGNHVVIGGLTGFHQFVKIGDYAMVGGLAKIIKDIPPYAMVDGHPGRVYGLNVVGLRRGGFSQEARNRIKNIYKLLYDRRLGRREALDQVEEVFDGDEYAEYIVAFARSLKRGLTPWIERDARAPRAEEADA